jgi:hypothetical protein
MPLIRGALTTTPAIGNWSIIGHLIDRLTVGLEQLVSALKKVVPLQFTLLLLGADSGPAVLLQVLAFFRPRSSLPDGSQALATAESPVPTQNFECWKNSRISWLSEF